MDLDMMRLHDSASHEMTSTRNGASHGLPIPLEDEDGSTGCNPTDENEIGP